MLVEAPKPFKSSIYRIGANFRLLGSPPIEHAELFLTVCGIERCSPDKAYGPMIRDDFHVHFVLSGKGTLNVVKNTYHLCRGQIFVTPPGVEIYYFSDPEDPWYYTWVSFSGSKAAMYLEKAGITAEHPVRDMYIRPEEFLTYTENILNHHELTIIDELTRTALLYEILALLIRSRRQNQTEHHQKPELDYAPDLYVNHAVAYIHEHYAHMQVRDIAEYIGITRSYLTHIFKQKLKVSPQEYLFNYRMEEGRRLLCGTNLSVQEIAEQIGYENPLTFSKIFKNAYGLSPKHYREKVNPRNETK